MEEHRILLVDDDPDLLEMLLSIFTNAGYHDLLAASSGAAALQLWREQKPDLIILDVMMPGMDGFAVLREIRRTSRVPVLMLTARGEAEDRIEGLETGADDYLSKTFSAQRAAAADKSHSQPRLPGAETPGQTGSFHRGPVPRGGMERRRNALSDRQRAPAV